MKYLRLKTQFNMGKVSICGGIFGNHETFIRAPDGWMQDNATTTCKTAPLHFTPNNRGLCTFPLDRQLQIVEVV